ncbi:undecaprenyl pyrophosphate synthase [mine drainage metagenome]|uniref:Undecaprenyl pyrophosphate synthetase (UPP synthetase) (Di-trans,poly-cis-decaprenylcistransferase) (Undecaprenyl diphosphate synthase) (UDS) n=1 Tax=mine drainage metagenome TaxID=410659 RepID=E6QQJ9_9ZZZZ
MHSSVPRHVAIIMDGNGRWAKKRFLPRIAGHKRGVDMVRKVVKASAERGIKFLTLFAFSSENWRRPADEVGLLMELFCYVLEHEIKRLHTMQVRVKIIGDMSRFDVRLMHLIKQIQEVTSDNQGLTLTIAANYGGRWDMLQAFERMLIDQPDLAGRAITEQHFSPYLSMYYAPEPDLFVRTGGEQRISNFLLWQLAYTELYFTPCLWPDFDEDALDLAITSFQQRERRYGRTSDQLT